MVQAKAVGLVKDIWEMRKIIANSLELIEYHPKDEELWEENYNKFLGICNKKA